MIKITWTVSGIQVVGFGIAKNGKDIDIFKKTLVGNFVFSIR